MLFDTSEFKSLFNQELLNKIRNKRNWATELSGLLHCSVSSIYKKTQQDSFFSLEEMLFLINYYSIDIKKVFTNDIGIVQFNVPSIKHPINNIDDYLNRLNSTFKGLGQDQKATVYYATRELPFFYYFLKPELTYFKLFIFAQSIWKLEHFVNSTFSIALFDDNVQIKCNKLWENYSKLLSIEYWNTKILDTTLQQIFYYYETGDLTMEDALKILATLEELNKELKNMTMANSKNPNIQNNFKLYENKIIHTSNHVLVKTEKKSGIYLAFDNPNFIYSDDPDFIKYSENWYQNIEDSSYLLGRGSGHQTAMFFNYLSKKIEQLANRIKSRF
ncbi:MAG: hypothetical protein IPO62_09950 [Saprospiraceae bacterium]|nr:hypothetical protein [Saprospiraceae bacterium]MBK9631367.1 hypothetical protein [Saprospiraceae bacterium]